MPVTLGAEKLRFGNNAFDLVSNKFDFLPRLASGT